MAMKNVVTIVSDAKFLFDYINAKKGQRTDLQTISQVHAIHSA
jgi:hypothetical protein